MLRTLKWKTIVFNFCLVNMNMLSVCVCVLCIHKLSAMFRRFCIASAYIWHYIYNIWLHAIKFSRSTDHFHTAWCCKYDVRVVWPSFAVRPINKSLSIRRAVAVVRSNLHYCSVAFRSAYQLSHIRNMWPILQSMWFSIGNDKTTATLHLKIFFALCHIYIRGLKEWKQFAEHTKMG